MFEINVINILRINVYGRVYQFKIFGILQSKKNVINEIKNLMNRFFLIVDEIKEFYFC